MNGTVSDGEIQSERQPGRVRRNASIFLIVKDIFLGRKPSLNDLAKRSFEPDKPEEFKEASVVSDSEEIISSSEKENAEFDDENVKNILRISCRPDAIQNAAEHENKFLSEHCKNVGLLADIGCGTARMSRILRDGYAGYHGFEFSKDMVELATLNVQQVVCLDMLRIVEGYNNELSFNEDTRKIAKLAGVLRQRLDEFPVDLVELSVMDKSELSNLLVAAQKMIDRVYQEREALYEQGAQDLFDRLEEVKSRKALIVEGDAAKAKMSPEIYDRVICCFFTSGNFRDEDRKVYDKQYLDRMGKFIEIYNNFYGALKPGGKIFFSIYRGDEESNSFAERTQRDFYRKCGLDLITGVGSPFVATRQGNFWSRRWTKESVLKNLAYCGISADQVSFHKLGKGDIGWMVEIRKPYPTEMLKQETPVTIKIRNGKLDIPEGLLRGIGGENRELLGKIMCL
ncbi:MAG: class I SAM-dependent methyltransferase [Candidatus Gracilibacteria bacterium]|nr:class I SAM-dependent methyltransferase [Candidatus Gracilibacteria bacterium]